MEKTISVMDNLILGSDELPKEKSYIPTFKTIETRIDELLQKILYVDSLTDEEIRDIIINHYYMILNYDNFLANNKTRSYAQMLFMNNRFLKVFSETIGTINLTQSQIICINKLAYDYYILPNKDNQVSELLLQISSQVNNILVIKLSGKLGMRGARLLSIVANSSFKLERNVERINTFLIKSGYEFSVQDIVDIYCILFDKFGDLIVYTMLQTKTPDMTLEQLKVFDNISLAILALLDNMVYKDIVYVLQNYAYMLKYYPINKVRFSLKSAKSYTKIITAINEVESSPLTDKETIIP